MRDRRQACYMKRNKYMVDQSALVIVVWDGRRNGGTAATVRYAKKQSRVVKFFNTSVQITAKQNAAMGLCQPHSGVVFSARRLLHPVYQLQSVNIYKVLCIMSYERVVVFKAKSSD